VVAVANRLPTSKAFPAFIEPGAINDEQSKMGFNAVSEASSELTTLVSDLLHLRATLTSKNETVKLVPADIVPKALESKKRKRASFEDASSFIHSTPETITSTFADIAAFDSAFKPFRDTTIEKWNAKVVAAAGGAAAALQMKKLKAINASVMSQVRTILEDRERLVKRTKLVRDSDGQRFGERPATATEENLEEQKNGEEDELHGVHPARRTGMDAHLSNYDNEIFDDGDFYQQLLKELIESRMSDTGMLS
jgi:protein AATF/BFR2